MKSRSLLLPYSIALGLLSIGRSWWDALGILGGLSAVRAAPRPFSSSRSFVKLPEASSTLLQMHSLYVKQPPHDRTLYNTLQVCPNATAHEITRAYRRLSRTLHPDKQTGSTVHTSNVDRLENVRHAYEVLKDDATRLPYHRYGLLDASHAVLLLTGHGGVGNGRHSHDPALDDLLRLVGYARETPAFPANSIGGTTDAEIRRQHHQARVYYLASHILERIRPFVENAVDATTLTTVWTEECDAVKSLPLGSQILRCVGRAYCYTARKTLRKGPRTTNVSGGASLRSLPSPALPDAVRDGYRSAKHLFTAAVASGRVVVTEHLSKSAKSSTTTTQAGGRASQNFLTCHFDDDLDVGTLPGETTDTAPTDEEIKQNEKDKARAALLESLQVEALWKISKLDLDRTIREACELILQGDYFFFPSHQSVSPSDWQRQDHGWVGSTGRVIGTDEGRFRAAQALELLGKIMVQRSKEGTSWKA
jgi:hypothetical protein